MQMIRALPTSTTINATFVHKNTMTRSESQRAECSLSPARRAMAPITRCMETRSRMHGRAHRRIPGLLCGAVALLGLVAGTARAEDDPGDDADAADVPLD